MLRSSSGLLTSPNYPNSYPHQLNCLYTIISANGTSVTLYPLAFALANDCNTDFVQVYDGPTTNSALLGKFCSQRGPPVMRSTGNQVLVAVRTGSAAGSTGFAFSFTSSQNGKSGLLIHNFKPY